MKNKSKKNEGSKEAIDQLHHLAGPNPSVPKPSAPSAVTSSTGTVTSSTGTAGGYSVSSSSGTTGGTVSTGGKSLDKNARQALEEFEAATFRKHAQQLRTASNTCNYNIHNLGWSYCNVAVEFENNRVITYEEALIYAKRLDLWADLREAIDVAIQTPDTTGSMSCNYFAGAVGKKLDIPYFRNPLDDDHHMANNMYDFISGAVNSHASGWIKLDEANVQEKADEGKFIVGVAHSLTDTHGHIVIAVPTSLLPQERPHERSIPCILDGQKAADRPLKSYIPIQAFGNTGKVTEPIWAYY